MASKRVIVSTTRTFTSGPSYSAVAARPPPPKPAAPPALKRDDGIHSITSKRAAKRWLKDIRHQVDELEKQKAANTQRYLSTVATELEALKLRAKDDLELERTAEECANKVLQ